MSVVPEPRKTDVVWSVMGVAVCISISALVAHAIFESRFGTTFVLDDSPPAAAGRVPFIAGALLGLMQVRLFGTKVVVVAAVVHLFARPMVGVWAWFELVTVLIMCFGGVVGWLIHRGLPAPGRRSRAIAAAALAASAVVAVVSLATKPPDPVAVPLTRVITPPGGPAVLLHGAQRDFSPSRSGTLADVDGCLGVVNVRPDARRFVVIWPKDAIVETDPYRITFEGRTHYLGDEVIVTNGLLGSPVDTRAYFEGAPASCAGNALII